MIDIAMDFTRFPAGRHRVDGHFSGERFRDDFLIPAMKEDVPIRVKLDGTAGFGSSFLEEAFGGLVRVGYDSDMLLHRIEFESADPTLVEEIRSYICAAQN